MKVKEWGGEMKNREEWRRIVQESKAHPELWRRRERIYNEIHVKASELNQIAEHVPGNYLNLTKNMAQYFIFVWYLISRTLNSR
jgi:hypothetical protein